MAEPAEGIDIADYYEKLPELIEIDVDDLQYFRFGGTYSLNINNDCIFYKKILNARGYKPKQVTFLFKYMHKFYPDAWIFSYKLKKHWFMITQPYHRIHNKTGILKQPKKWLTSTDKFIDINIKKGNQYKTMLLLNNEPFEKCQVGVEKKKLMVDASCQTEINYSKLKPKERRHLKKIGIVNKAKEKIIDMDSEEMKGKCSVCLEDLMYLDTKTTLPCKHEFHTECILPWICEHLNCPNCRQDVIR